MSHIDLEPIVSVGGTVRLPGPKSISLAELEMRYFYTNEGFENEIIDCYFAHPGCEKLITAIKPLSPERELADHYLSVKFTANAGSVPANGSLTFELAIHESQYRSYDRDSDYSYDASKTSYAARESVCLYRNGTLIWGTEPTP